MENMTKAKMCEMIEHGEIVVVYAKDKTKESAQALANMIDAAVGIATFIDDDGKAIYGVMINKDLMNLANNNEEEKYD